MVVCNEIYCVYDFFLVDVSNGVTIVHLIYLFFVFLGFFEIVHNVVYKEPDYGVCRCCDENI